jgi:CheY-like chemotaxis protein
LRVVLPADSAEDPKVVQSNKRWEDRERSRLIRLLDERNAYLQNALPARHARGAAAASASFRFSQLTEGTLFYPILCVEDALVTGLLVKTVCDCLGYKIVVTTRICEAKELIRAPRRFLMYLLDVCLPDGNGIDLCRWIRESDSSTPIILCSATPSYLHAGAQAFVSKSGNIEVLESTIRRLACAGVQTESTGHAEVFAEPRA